MTGPASSPRQPDNAPPRPAPGGALVIQTAFLGDTVLTLPLLLRLARRHGPVDVLTTPPALPIVAGHPAVRRVILFDKHGRDAGIGGVLRVAGLLRRVRYTSAYLPHGSIRSALLARLAGIPERTGFSGAPGAFLYSDARMPGVGAMSLRISTLAPGTVEPLPPPPWLSLSAADIARADSWLRDCGVPPRFVAFAPGARWATKRWPHFADLAAAIPDPIVVIGGEGDVALGTAITDRAPGRSWNAAGTMPLAVSAAVLARAALLITNDSAPLHLATALGVPVIALFGPTVPAFGFGPVWPEDQVLEHPALPCRPCHQHGPMVCPLGHHRCMRELEVARVVEAILAIGGRR